jgi:endogenous inhibitor of DNA gyrase (YacG/DUF329 family)
MIDAALAKPCPICGKPADARLKPFCSARCADVDLNRWFTGAYAIPARDEEDAEEAPTAARKNERNRNG